MNDTNEKIEDLKDDVEKKIIPPEEDKKNKPEGSGIFTVDGKELPKIEGGYTAYHGGGTIGENNLK